MKQSLFVAGLDFSVTSDELSTLFSQYGTVVSAKVITDNFSGKSRGFGFVEMSTAQEAADCITSLNNSSYKNRQLVVKEKEDNPSKKSSGSSRPGTRRSW